MFYDNTNDHALLLLKQSKEHFYCENYRQCIQNGGIKSQQVCKNFRNKFWSELAQFVNREFILNGDQKQK